MFLSVNRLLDIEQIIIIDIHCNKHVELPLYLRRCIHMIAVSEVLKNYASKLVLIGRHLSLLGVLCHKD